MDSPAGPSSEAPSSRLGDVVCVGAFEPDERAFLASQFGACRFELIGRSVRDRSLALVYWEGSSAGSGGPSPLLSAPRRAAYVVGPAPGVAAVAGGAIGGDAGHRRRFELVRLDSQADLDRLYAGHFPGVRLSFPLWDRVRRRFGRLLPALMLLVAIVWGWLALWALGVVR